MAEYLPLQVVILSQDIMSRKMLRNICVYCGCEVNILSSRSACSEVGMKQEYDFSKGERGKFFRQDAKRHISIYLDEEVLTYLGDLSI